MSKAITGFELHRITGLGRTLDLHRRSNQLALLIPAIFGLIALAIGLLGDADSWLLEAAGASIGSFLGWALGREIDPDQESTAIVAMTISGVAALVSAPSLLAVAVLLLVARILSRTVGSDLRRLDLVVVLGASAVAGSQPVAWPIAALLVFAVFRQLSGAALPMAIVMSLTAIGSAALFVDSLSPGVPSFLVLLLIFGLGIFGWRRIRATSVETKADSGEPIAAGGVGLARLATFFAFAAGALLVPESAIVDLSPAVAAFAALAVLPRRAPRPRQVINEPPALVGTALPPVV